MCGVFNKNFHDVQSNTVRYSSQSTEGQEPRVVDYAFPANTAVVVQSTNNSAVARTTNALKAIGDPASNSVVRHAWAC